MKKLFSALCAFALCFGLITTAFAGVVDYGVEINPEEKTYSQIFSDIPENHWAFRYIAELVDRGAINGYPDGKFYPDKNVTREEFAKIMVVAAGLTAKPADASSYADVPLTYWASPFIETAKPYMTAYQSGGQAYFKPTDGALREDMAVAIVMLKGYDTRLADLSMIKTMFSDVDAISASAQPYVALAVENGIISGYVDGTFRGQATITRSEAAAMLWRAFQYGSDSKLMPGETPAPAPSAEPAATPSTSPAPEETLEPEETPVPEETPKPYQIDTLDSGYGRATDFRSMVVKNDGTVVWLAKGVIHNSETSDTISLASDLSYDLGRDDKNFDFSMDEKAALAYDKNKDAVYLVGETADGITIYDITDFATPEMKLCQSNHNRVEHFTDFNKDYDDSHGYCTRKIAVLPNGALLMEAYMGCFMVDPNTASVSQVADTSQTGRMGTTIIGSKIIYDNGDSIRIKDIAGSSNSVSVEDGLPETDICSGNNMIYAWTCGDDESVITGWDLDGWKQEAIGQEDIEALDYKPLPEAGLVHYIATNGEGTFAILDRASDSLRVIRPAESEES